MANCHGRVFSRCRNSENRRFVIARTSSRIRALSSDGLLFPKIEDLGWDDEYRTLTYGLLELEPGKRYAMPLRGDLFHDLAGNGVVDFDLVFTTEE